VWDDEELVMGRRRDANGRFTSTQPKVVPAACVKELNRRKLFETEPIIRNACTEAANYLAAVTRGDDSPNVARQRAAETILDRFLGKPKESVDLKLAVQEPPWVQAQRVIYEWGSDDEGPGDPVQSQATQVRAQQQAGLAPEREYPDIIDAEVSRRAPRRASPSLTTTTGTT
jgi:hypothetical protein